MHLTKANEFIIGFMENAIVSTATDTLPLLITTDEPCPVNFTVEATNPQFLMTGIATYGSITTLQLPKDVTIMSDSQRNKGIHVKAEGDKTISVYGSNHEVVSSDTFTALPCIDYPVTLVNGRRQRHRYHIFSGSSTAISSSQFLIISCRDNTEIRLIPSQSIQIPFDIETQTRIVAAGQRATFNLDRLQTYMVQSRQDLTGTVVVSDYPIAVFTGHQCGNVPVGARRCEFFVEAVPSHFTWGTLFFTAPFAGRRSGEIVRIAALNRDLTVVNVTCSTRGLQPSPGNFTTTNLTANEGFSFTTGPDDFCCIESSQPILVMQYATGASTDPGNDFSDPFLMTVPPVQQYANNFTIASSDSVGAGFTETYLNILVSAQFFDNTRESRNSIRLNNARASGTWSAIYCASRTICGYGTQISLSPEVSNVFHLDSTAGIGVLVYGYGTGVSYGYPAGFKLEPITCECYQ